MLLGDLGHSILECCNLDLVGTKDLAKSAWVVMEEGFAQVVEILWGEFKEHFELGLLDFLEHILVVK